MSPALDEQWITDAHMPVYVGGAELNVASALTAWKQPVRYVSAMPDHYLSKEIISYLGKQAIDVSKMILGGDRIGAYYLPQGGDLGHQGVIYDRAHSSFAAVEPGTVDWDVILDGCTWFHFSAISPALTRQTAALCKEALEAATRKGLTISVDLNYRAKLWQYGLQPVDVMPELVNYCHVIMGNPWAVQSLLGLASPLSDGQEKSKEELLKAARVSMESLGHHYPMASTFAYTFRMQDEYFGVLSRDGDVLFTGSHIISDVTDRVGSGDCFMGGLIYGLSQNHEAGDIIDFAAAAAVGKLYEAGDSTRQTVEEVMKRIR